MSRFSGEGYIFLVVEGGKIWRKGDDGGVEEVERGWACELLSDVEVEVLLCYKARVLAFLGLDSCEAAVYDVLGLYGFVRPARFCVPSVRGVGDALGMALSEETGGGVLGLESMVEILLEELSRSGDRERAGGAAMFMGRGGWLWAPYVLEACGAGDVEKLHDRTYGMDSWRGLDFWTDLPSKGESLNESVDEEEALGMLDGLVESRGKEKREGQRDYLRGVTRAFGEYDSERGPHMVLAEGETGVGKTLGYLVPSVMWSRRNGVSVWISTYSRYLQGQVERESLDVWGSSDVEEDGCRKLVVRQGRENYVCLLNYEEALWDMGMSGDRAIALGYVSRWLGCTKDGNLHHGDFPTWLRTLEGVPTSFDGLSDRRGHCIFNGCRHYRRCFIEREQRLADLAEIVVSNHALSLLRLLHQEGEDGEKIRMVFDEGHHLLDVADSTLSIHVSVLELMRVRHWILGREVSGSRLEKGLRQRLLKVGGVKESIFESVEMMELEARRLPGEGCLGRIRGGEVLGSCERLFLKIHELVLRRDESGNRYYEQELLLGSGYFGEGGDEICAEVRVLGLEMLGVLRSIARSGKFLLEGLLELRDSDLVVVDVEGFRGELTGAIRSLEMWLSRRLEGMLHLLESVLEGSEDTDIFVDRAVIERVRGYETDVGLTRHFLDPGDCLSDLLRGGTSGLVVTSGTLSMRRKPEEERWKEANVRLGLRGFGDDGSSCVAVDSPFDWVGQTRLFLVNDVDKNDIGALVEAFSVLMESSGGGTLGLFTSLERMRRVVPHLRSYLSDLGLDVYAQHMDKMAISDLVRIFGSESDSCLVGSDALRDGLDVGGMGLRQVIFERLPWPRPDILHKKRREVFGGWSYTRTQMGWKLRQAYGRLLRRKEDRGVMVVLEGKVPGGSMAFFPEGVEPMSMSLREVSTEVRSFFM